MEYNIYHILYYIWFLAAIYEWNIIYYIKLCYLEPQVTSILKINPSKTKLFPSKTKVI